MPNREVVLQHDNAPWNLASRIVYSLAALGSAAACYGAYGMVSRYMGSPGSPSASFGLLVATGIGAPLVALAGTLWFSKQGNARRVRIGLWIFFLAISLYPQLQFLVAFLPRWLWQHVDVTTRPPQTEQLLSNWSLRLCGLSVITVPLWVMSEIIIYWIFREQPTRAISGTGEVLTESTETSVPHDASSGRSLLAYGFMMFEGSLGIAALITALNHGKILGLFGPLPGLWFTLSFTHFLIAYSLLSRNRIGRFPIVANLIAWLFMFAQPFLSSAFRFTVFLFSH